MNIEDAVLEISENVKKWSIGKSGIVVGIDGYSGAGKTTILKLLAEKNNFVKPIFMDDFVSTANTKEKLLPQIEANTPELNLEWSPPDGLEKIRSAIAGFKSKAPQNVAVVVEGIFLFHPKVLNDIWDRRIYLDANKEEADARRVVREKERWGEKYFPETHPDSFARLFKIAHKRYEELYNPKQRSDWVIQVD